MVHCSCPVTQSHVGRQGEDLVSSLNKLQLETGLVYRPVLGRRLTTNNDGAA